MTHRFQRFCSGSGTGKPVCGSSGSRPIGAEPEPEPVVTAEKWPSGSRTARGATASDVHGSRSPAILPRLLNLRQMAAYLGCSYWSARDWVLAGWVPVVVLPPLRPREGERRRTTLRRVLVDREDLDCFIDARKRGGSQDIQSRARPIEAENTRGNRATVPALCPSRGAAQAERPGP